MAHLIEEEVVEKMKQARPRGGTTLHCGNEERM